MSQRNQSRRPPSSSSSSSYHTSSEARKRHRSPSPVSSHGKGRSKRPERRDVGRERHDDAIVDPIERAKAVALRLASSGPEGNELRDRAAPRRSSGADFYDDDHRRSDRRDRRRHEREPPPDPRSSSDKRDLNKTLNEPKGRATASQSLSAESGRPVKSGLNSVPVHPALQMLMAEGAAASNDEKNVATKEKDEAAPKVFSKVSLPPLLPPSSFSTVKANVRAAAMKSKASKKASNDVSVSSDMASVGFENGAAPVTELKPASIPSSFYNPSKNPYFDPSLKTKSMIAPRQRKIREFKFHEPGKFVQEAEDLRAEERMEALKRSIAMAAQKSSIVTELSLVSDKSLVREIVTMEWWDAPFFPSGEYDQVDLSVLNPSTGQPLISNTIFHPVPLPPPNEAITNADVVRPLMLTKQERKKLRRQNRQAALKEKQDLIRMGVLPPDQPKVKMSNLMRVLGTEAVLDPTQIEANVKAQVEARLAKHLVHNASHKLTDEEKREKRNAKMAQEASSFTYVAVFRIKDLSHPKNKFKVDQNAKQWNMSGVTILMPGMSLVVVEGGPKGISAYKKLMLRRIDWSGRRGLAEGDDDMYQDGGDAESLNACQLVWEGNIPNPLFSGFRFKTFESDVDVRDYLEKFGAVQYWDAARSMTSWHV